MNKLIHGHCTPKNSPTYKSWLGMWERCENPNSPRFKDYGGRGITVCDRWEDFICFLEDMGERPRGMTIDRKDNNDGYMPDNCRWATPKEQCRNRKNNRILEHDGQQHCLSRWAEIVGIEKHTIRERLKRGWSVARALTQPPCKAG